MNKMNKLVECIDMGNNCKLTIWKVYKVLCEDDLRFQIKNDTNELFWYRKDLFKEVEGISNDNCKGRLYQRNSIEDDHCKSCKRLYASKSVDNYVDPQAEKSKYCLESESNLDNFEIEYQVKKIKDEILNPSYYAQYKIEPIEFMKANDLGYFEGNIIKYVCRYKNKNGLDDLIKARNYIDHLINKFKEDNK